MKSLTVKKAREQITCTGQEAGDIRFQDTVIGRMTSSPDAKGKMVYETIITTNGEHDDDTVPHHLKASKRNALLDKVAKLVSTSVNDGTWHY